MSGVERSVCVRARATHRNVQKFNVCMCEVYKFSWTTRFPCFRVKRLKAQRKSCSSSQYTLYSTTDHGEAGSEVIFKIILSHQICWTYFKFCKMPIIFEDSELFKSVFPVYWYIGTLYTWSWSLLNINKFFFLNLQCTLHCSKQEKTEN